jgi:hypothetical protein
MAAYANSCCPHLAFVLQVTMRRDLSTGYMSGCRGVCCLVVFVGGGSGSHKTGRMKRGIG